MLMGQRCEIKVLIEKLILISPLTQIVLDEHKQISIARPHWQVSHRLLNSELPASVFSPLPCPF